MGYLRKEDILIRRDEKGNLLPVEIQLELLPEKPTVKITPLTKGEIQRLFAVKNENQQDEESATLCKHCIEPSFTQEEFEFIKPEIYGAIKIAILSLSLNKEQTNLQSDITAALTEEELKKNS